MSNAANANLILIGASVRAAAMSALRAGLQPWCADLFADADLQRLCPVVRLDKNYPAGFVDLIQKAPPGPWLYTGALENWPDILDRIAATRPLWGNPPEVVRPVRSPRLVYQALHRRGLPCPEIATSSRTDPGKQWLLKPVRGGGGRNIRFWAGGKETVPAGYYLQEYIKGDPCSAIFFGDESVALLLGITRQLVGLPNFHAPAFGYCGSIVLEPEAQARVHAAIQRLGQVLTEEFHLRGFFGVDYLLSHGVSYPVEINPRYTASVEVLEYATGISALGWHNKTETSTLAGASGSEKYVGKGILFARNALTFPGEGPWMQTLAAPWSPWRIPAFADIPHAGARIRPGQPMLTFFAEAESAAACLSRLQVQAADLNQRFFGAARVSSRG